MSINLLCPITQAKGHLLRTRKPDELFSSYERYLGAPLPQEFYSLYFKEAIYEYESDVSGLRWYTPSLLGNGDYYAALARTYSWYYNPASWDKICALDRIQSLNPTNVVEIGSGDGWLLDKLKERKQPAYGIDINEPAVKKCRDRGLNAFLPGEAGLDAIRGGVLCLLQTIEHVSNPLEFAAGFVRQLQPQNIVMSAPCFEGLLGHTNDPLVWPPHHATAWSQKAFETLAGLLGFKVSFVAYSPMNYRDLNDRLSREGSRKLPDVPFIPPGRIGSAMFKMHQLLGRPWACRGHSILVVMSKKA
jgi:SAM-dependent methyltransferase